jgi:hypothetical protein
LGGSLTSSLHAGSSAHFPKTAFVDPALQRTSNLGAKETKVFQLDEDVNQLPVGHQGAAFERNYSWKRGAMRFKQWAECLKYTDPIPTTLAMTPALWGAGLAMTKALVWDGADPVVLCAPFVPVHLVLFSCAFGFLIRGTIACGPSWLRGPTASHSTMLESLKPYERSALLCGHAAFSFAVLLNVAPAASGCAVAAAMIFGVSRLIQSYASTLGGGDKKVYRRVIWAQSFACAMSAPAGYAAVSGVVDPLAAVPLYLAAVLWNNLHLTMWSLIEQREAELEGSTNSPTLPSNAATVSTADSVTAKKPTMNAGSSGSSIVATATSQSTIALPTGAPKKKVSGFRSSQNTYGTHSDAVEKLLPKYFQDTKFAWNLQLVPVSLGLAFAGVFSSQTLFFYGGVLISIAYLQGIVDHINIYDLWSTRMNYKRNLRFACIVMVCIGCSNAFWGLATEHKPEEDRADSAGPNEGSLKKILRMHIVAHQRSYDATDFSIADRFFRPAWVQMRVLALKNENNPAVSATQPASPLAQEVPAESAAAIPPWMRREYLGQNVGSLARMTGLVAEESIQAAEKWWYERLDHYNVFTQLML